MANFNNGSFTKLSLVDLELKSSNYSSFRPSGTPLKRRFFSGIASETNHRNSRSGQKFTFIQFELFLLKSSVFVL